MAHSPHVVRTINYLAANFRIMRKVAHEKPTVVCAHESEEALDEKVYEKIVKDFDHKLDKMMKDLDESQNYIESRIDALKIDHIIETTAATAAEKVGDKLADQYVKAEHLMMILEPIGAQTVALMAADLAPKLDLLTADVNRKIKTVEANLGDVEKEVTEKLIILQRDLETMIMDCCAGSDDDDSDDESDEGPG